MLYFYLITVKGQKYTQYTLFHCISLYPIIVIEQRKSYPCLHGNDRSSCHQVLHYTWMVPHGETLFKVFLEIAGCFQRVLQSLNEKIYCIEFYLRNRQHKRLCFSPYFIYSNLIQIKTKLFILIIVPIHYRFYMEKNTRALSRSGYGDMGNGKQ